MHAGERTRLTKPEFAPRNFELALAYRRFRVLRNRRIEKIPKLFPPNASHQPTRFDIRPGRPNLNGSNWGPKGAATIRRTETRSTVQRAQG